MSVYNVGDLIEAVKGKRRVQDIATAGEGAFFTDGPYLGTPSLFGYSSIESYERGGYIITVIEKAKPPLPTEPGWYLIGSLNEAVYLAADGYWTTPRNFGVTGEDMATFGPFTRLEPVAETAKRVIDHLAVTGTCRSDGGVAREIAAKFGVTK